MNLETDEALLTGESLSVAKDANLGFDNQTGVGDHLNIIFSSSTVTKGRGRGVVFATGMNTEVGSIAAALHERGQIMRPVQRNANGTTRPVDISKLGLLHQEILSATFLGSTWELHCKGSSRNLQSYSSESP
jgi:magnesium-transporting ATPase (P-type)